MSDPLLVLLDLDGTIIDSAPGIVAGMREAFAAAGSEIPTDDVLRSWIGPPVLRTLERELGARGPDVVNRANGAFRQYFDTVGAHETDPFPGMVDALATLSSAGSTIAVVTHKPLPLAEMALAEHALGGFVSATYAPPSPGTWVPKGDLFASALGALPPARAIAAGDRAGDIEAALAHGVPSVGVTWGYGTVEELQDAKAVALAASAEELVAMLREYATPLP